VAVKREKNSEKSRQDILAAAEEQFAAKGFYGARIDEIAHQANINKRMIYEYFTNKENLYKKVLFNVYKRMEIAESKILETKVTGKELIRNIISMYFDFLRDNPNFVNILMWENLNKAAYLNEMPSSDVERPTINYIKEEIRRGKEAGIFKKSIDEEQAVISLIVVCFSNFSNRYTLSKLFAKELSDKDMLEKRKQHTIDIMLEYMCENNRKKAI